MFASFDEALGALFMDQGVKQKLLDEVSTNFYKGGVIDLTSARARWISHDSIIWNVQIPSGAMPILYYHPNRAISINNGNIVLAEGGREIPLEVKGVVGENDSQADQKLVYLNAFNGRTRICTSEVSDIRSLLQGALLIAIKNAENVIIDATTIQMAGVLDDLFAYDGILGVSFCNNRPMLSVWAPTATAVSVLLYNDGINENQIQGSPIQLLQVMSAINEWTGVWQITLDASHILKYYLYEIHTYMPQTRKFEINQVTDPYSVSLAMDSTRSQIVDLNDPSLKPEDWDSLVKPTVESPRDMSIYELHVRDFSINDQTVPEHIRGTFKAFTEVDSNGMKHLKGLAGAGLTHIHLLPVFDFVTVNENKADQIQPHITQKEAVSKVPQAEIGRVKDADGFNWGYDPYHFTTPEGSYATNPNGTTRIIEFREMVKSLSDNGLRVVMDVVYNHTYGSSLGDASVLDKVVPMYYHRLNDDGKVETSTCCQDTASEHVMMEKLIIDSLLVWAKMYKVDSFRFDLMGHHTVSNMQKIKTALQNLTMENDQIDGKAIYVYGEGWKFGSLNSIAPDLAAVQVNMSGTGIGSFNDRIRDAIRGGGPFDRGDTIKVQGVVSGLFTDPSAYMNVTMETCAQEALFLSEMDQLRVGLAANLKDYEFVSYTNECAKGETIDYKGESCGYASNPSETITYMSAHDNETFWDILQYKLPVQTPVEDRVRMQNLAISLITLSHGIPFFHAGVDMLRSKSLDRNSYNSGDWFNKLDFSYVSNNWAVGMPPQEENSESWPAIHDILMNQNSVVNADHIKFTATHIQEMLKIRKSSYLFRLQTGEDVIKRLLFLNTGAAQIRGLIVMAVSNNVSEGVAALDSEFDQVVSLFNVSNKNVEFSHLSFIGKKLELHKVQKRSVDTRLNDAQFDPVTGTFSIPARTTVVFVELR